MVPLPGQLVIGRPIGALGMAVVALPYHVVTGLVYVTIG